MEPQIKPVHKTNKLALTILALITLAVVGIFFKMQNDSMLEVNTVLREVSPKATTTSDTIESDLDAALSIDSSSELNTIDKEF